MFRDYPPGFPATQGHGIVLALPSQSDPSAQHESSHDSVRSPARLTPPNSPGVNSVWVELEDFRTPSHGQGHWGTPSGSRKEPTPPIDLYSPATPSSSYGPPPQVTSLH